MEDCNLPPWEPPADMERRRLAGLERFKRKNPDYMEDKLKPTQLDGNRNRNSCGGKSTSKTNKENRWSLQTTLELLDEMKAFVRSRKLSSVGTSKSSWKLIASKLSNPCGMDLEKYARSCQVRSDNIRRILRGQKRRGGGLEAEVKDSVAHFDEICAHFAHPKKFLNTPCTPGTDKKIILKVSTDPEDDTLNYSHLSVTASATSAHNKTSVDKQTPESNDCVIRKSGLGKSGFEKVGSRATLPPVKKARPMRGCRTRMALRPATNA